VYLVFPFGDVLLLFPRAKISINESQGIKCSTYYGVFKVLTHHMREGPLSHAHHQYEFVLFENFHPTASEDGI